MQHRRIILALVIAALLSVVGSAQCPAQESARSAGSLVELKLTDGTKIVGEIINDAPDSVMVRTTAGVEMTVPRTTITSMKPATGHLKGGRYLRKDPNYARLLFAPTGRPLQKGQGYITDTYVLLPGVAYGITNQFSMLIGFSLVPGIDFNDQVLYIVPKFGVEISKTAAISIGALYTSFWDDVSAGIVYSVGTIGEHDRSLHAGLGLGFTKESGSDFEFAKRPVFVVGGNLRLSNGVALVGESWPIPAIDLGRTIVPVAVAVRFFGDNIAIDVGAVIEKHVIAEGFPIPWLTAAYNFGKI